MSDTTVAPSPTTRDWVARLDLRRIDGFDRTAAVLVAGNLALVSYLVVGGGLYIDDIRAQAYAAGEPIWPFIVQSNGTHLSPGARTVDWFMATFAPLEHWPAVALTLLLSLTLAWATWRLLCRVVPSGWARCVGLFWVLYTPTIVPTLAWFRQALTTMTAVVLIIVAVTAWLDQVRSPRTRHLVVATVAHAGALMFSERAVCVPLVALAIAVAPFSGRRRRHRLRVVLRWLAPMTVVDVLFLYAYSSGQYDKASAASPSVPGLVGKLGRSTVVDTLPMFLGGPVHWRRAGGPYSFASTPVVLVVVASVALLLLLVALMRSRGRRRPVATAAAVASAYVVPVSLIIYVGRLAKVAAVEAVDDLRLLPDVTIAVAIVLAVLLSALADGRRPILSTRAGLAGLGIAVVVVALTTWSWVGFARQWHRTTTPAYLSALRADLGSDRSAVIPGTVPSSLIPPWVAPDFSTASLIELLRPSVQTTELGSLPLMVGANGHLRPATVSTVAGARVPSGFCGQAIPAGTQTVTISMERRAPYFRGGFVEVSTLVGDATRLSLAVVDDRGRTVRADSRQHPTLLRGPHQVIGVLPLGTAVRAIVVTVLTPNSAGVCITSGRVAFLPPLP